jgi:hypothetical protein
LEDCRQDGEIGRMTWDQVSELASRSLCKDPRDKHYGMLALVSKKIRIEARYEESWKMTDVIREIFRKERATYAEALILDDHELDWMSVDEVDDIDMDDFMQQIFTHVKGLVHWATWALARQKYWQIRRPQQRTQDTYAL